MLASIFKFIFAFETSIQAKFLCLVKVAFMSVSQADKFRSAWQSINSSKLYHKNSSKSLNFVILTCLCHTLLFSCHTERSEVSTNLKCDFSALRYILNSWIFRSQSSLKMTMEIFRFLTKAQNDKIFVILICLTEHSFCHTEPLAKYP